MDIESDGSERWEDFFGSSTDIGLGFLDTLANNFNEEARQLVESSSNHVSTSLSPPVITSPPAVPSNVLDASHPENATPVRSNKSGVGVGDGSREDTPVTSTLTQQPSASSAVTTSHPTDVQIPVRPVRKRSDRFLSLVSPNVRRMVCHTTDTNGSSPTGTHPPAGVGTCVSSNVQSGVPVTISSPTSSRKTKQPGASLALTPLGTQKKLPLSNAITKLSKQLINDQAHENGPESVSRHRSVGRSSRERLVGSRSTSETATNCATEDLSRKCSEENEAIDRVHSSREAIHNVSTFQRKIHLLMVGLEETEAGEGQWTTKVAPGSSGSTSEEKYPSQVSLNVTQPNSEGEESVEDPRGVEVTLRSGHAAMNHDALVENAFVKNCIDSSDHRKTVVEAINPHPNLGVATTKLSPANPERSPVTKAGSFLDNATHSTSTSTPSLDTANSSGSVYSSKMSLVPPSTPVLSSRPLSSSSICSFSSSSSSSGSEHLLMGGKSAPPSYQASVESLADPSESEQTVLGAFVADAGTIGVGMTMCERSVREIIDSESSYVKDLGQVIRGYLEDWKERACLKPDQLNVLFSNIQQIYDFNFKLLNRLREARGDPVAICDCFIDLHVEFSCYTKYCTSYPEAISLLTTLLQATHTNALLVSTQKMLKHTLPLGSYLLKPVQRILKYHLLLENLRKHCSDQQVALAHELMKKVAQNIDQMKKKLDQQRKVKELAGILDGWLGPDLSVLGDLLREGLLTEHGKPRIVLLFQSMLIIAKPKEDKRLQFRAYIPCKNLMLVEHLPGEPASFNVIPFDDPKGVLKLTARSREEKRQWTQQIKQAMLQHYADIPPRAMELVLQLGDEDQRFTDKPYWKRPTNNSPVPEYLERRQQFRRSEMRMKSKRSLMKKDAPTPTFRSYSSDLEPSVASEPTDTSTELLPHSCANPEECKCNTVKKQLQEEVKNRADTLAQRKQTPVLARSRSVVQEEEQERLKKSLYERRKLSAPLKKQLNVREESLEGINTYNSTMIPKRITDMRKRRPKTLTGSSTFYTDLNVEQGTEAEVDVSGEHCSSTEHPSIVEPLDDTSVDNVSLEASVCSSVTEGSQESEAVAPVENGRVSSGKHLKDADIITKLIMEKDQFNKILSKPLTKKKSFDSSSCVRPVMNPPEPPSTEPPCDEEPCVTATICVEARERSVSGGADDEEPIYESLLRNVHVPYKYAPSSVGRHSLPCVEKPKFNNCQMQVGPPPPPLSALPRKTRPESDYVTLAYSELGLLERIGGENDGGTVVRRLGSPQISSAHAKTPQLLRNSDTNISYHRENSTPTVGTRDVGKEPTNLRPTSPAHEDDASVMGPDESFANGSSKQAFLERQGSLNMKTTAAQKSILQRFISLHASAISSRMLGSEGNLLHGDAQPLQRKLSDPNGGYGAAGCGGGGGGSVGHIYKLGSMDLGSRIAQLDYADPKTLFAQPSSASSCSMQSMGSNGNNNVLINQESMKSHVYHPVSHDQRDSVLASSSSSDSFCEEMKPSLAGMDDENSFYERTVEECLEHDFRDSAVYSGDDNDRRADRCNTGGEEVDQRNVYETVASARVTGRNRFSGPPPPIPTKPAHLNRLKRFSAVGPAVASPKPSANNRGWVLQQVKRFQ
ncbi:uncharacterized protein LOC131294793 [Anopheles ziemanni]|uniref:uncharacterized protein LOC131267056 n=1 Tax=Anopheles coustani TaxID=139045 RepID=UPI00265B0E3F|nr:uncharacterized protein LOC131267056 [Anopheles coustani]XP_058178820.1 uncharacterized protein LOC131294793 [Anopheles ziemanni]